MWENWMWSQPSWYCSWYNTCANSTLRSWKDKWSNRYEKYLWKKNCYTNEWWHSISTVIKNQFCLFFVWPLVSPSSSHWVLLSPTISKMCSDYKNWIVFWNQNEMIFRSPPIWIICTIFIINNENLNIDDDNNSDIFVTVCMVQITSVLRGINKITYINARDIYFFQKIWKPEYIIITYLPALKFKMTLFS